MGKLYYSIVSPASPPQTGFVVSRRGYRLRGDETGVHGVKIFREQDGGDVRLPVLGSPFDNEHPRCICHDWECNILEDKQEYREWTYHYSTTADIMTIKGVAPKFEELKRRVRLGKHTIAVEQEPDADGLVTFKNVSETVLILQIDYLYKSQSEIIDSITTYGSTINSVTFEGAGPRMCRFEGMDGDQFVTADGLLRWKMTLEFAIRTKTPYQEVGDSNYTERNLKGLFS